MDLNTKKVEIIQHIIMIQDPETLKKVDRFIHGLDIGEEEYTRIRTPEKKIKDNSRVGAKNKITGIFKISK